MCKKGIIKETSNAITSTIDNKITIKADEKNNNNPANKSYIDTNTKKMCHRKSWHNRVLAALLAVALVLAAPLAGSMIVPDNYGVYGAANISCSGDTASATQKSSVSMILTISNSGTTLNYDSATLSFDSNNGLDITGGYSGSQVSLDNGGSIALAFDIDVEKNATTGTRYGTLTLSNGGSAVYESGASNIRLTITEALSEPNKTAGTYVGVAAIDHSITPAEGFSEGDGNEISFEIFNNGNTIIKDATATIVLPDGMSVYNESNSVNMGYISTGTRKNISFPITVGDTVTGGNHAITLKITGRSYNNGEVNIEKSFYIPVLAGSSAVSSKNIAIQNVNIPPTITSGKDFNLSFNVKNTGSATAKNLKVYVELPEGLMNKTTTTFVENSFGAGNTRSYSVTLFSNTGGNTYPVKIGVAPLSGTDKGDVIQYVSCYVEGDSANAKTPQLMIDSYSYGGSSVQAGSTCVLHLDLFNTSGKELTNVKVSLKSEDGVFVPLGGSSSFFVESIPAKGHYAKSVMLSVKAGAEQGTSTLGVAMNYEDGNGNSFTPEDVIAIPVTQATRLVVDDIVAPMEAYVGEMGSAEIEFYNMGKSVLNNVRINATGNFDTYESNSYYAGNMASGSSDSYTFTFVPRETGSMEGTVVFTYENAGGEEETYEVPFAFEVMDAPIYDDEEMYPEDEGAGVPWKAIIGGIIILALVAGFVIWRKLRKRKLHKELELADSAFMDSMDIKDDADGDNNLGKGDGRSVEANSSATHDVDTNANSGAKVKAKIKSGTDVVQNGDKK